MRPVVDRLQSSYAGKVRITRINTLSPGASGQKLMQQFGVTYTPTFVFVDSHGAQQGLLIGQQAEAAMRTQLDALQ